MAATAKGRGTRAGATATRSKETAQTRKELIAGAVIAILAEEGVRSLTHRRIDARLGLPEGATSYHFSRRFDLLKAGFNKLHDDGRVEFERCYKPVLRKLETDEEIEVELVADCAFRHWKTITQASQRGLAIARFEFYLLATHDPRLLAVQNERRRALFDLQTTVFQRLGCRNSRRASAEFSRRAQADYVSHFIAPSFSPAVRTPDDLATRIRQIIAESDTLAADRGGRADQAALIAI